MGRIEDAFARRRALITYLCVGDPDEEESVELAVACADAGADVLELGCPFSDPTADGPAIARASQRALARGGGLEETLRVARAVRARKPDVGIVFFGYYNPLFVRGEAAAVSAIASAGIDAMLVVDLPTEEATSLRAAAAARGIGLIPLVAPTTKEARVALIGDVAKESPVPFVYYVSMTGVTGGAGTHDVLADAAAQAATIREATGRPTVVGFGIDTPERARIAANGADGIVVGSAIVRRIEEGRDREARLTAVRALVEALRIAV